MASDVTLANASQFLPLSKTNPLPNLGRTLSEIRKDLLFSRVTNYRNHDNAKIVGSAAPQGLICRCVRATARICRKSGQRSAGPSAPGAAGFKRDRMN